MKRIIYTVASAAAVAALGVTQAGAAQPPDPDSARISGSVGATVTDGSALRMRYVGDPAPAGYTGNYQRGPAVVTASPEDGPVTMSGTLDLSGMSENGQTAVVGLYDRAALAAGATGHKSEVGIYVTYRTRNGGYYDIGVTDGDAGGGEFVQNFVRIPVQDLADGVVHVGFTVDGTADPATCASDTADVATADGCMSLTVDGSTTVTDSYGTISPDGVETELGSGAHPGWYAAWTNTGPEIGVRYDLTVSPATLAPLTKEQCKNGGFADYGFSNQGRCINSLQANGASGRG